MAFVFQNTLSGSNFPAASDEFGLFLTPMQGADGSTSPPNGAVKNSLGIWAPLSGAGGAAPGYMASVIEGTIGTSPSNWLNQLNLIPGTGVPGSTDSGQPAFNGNTAIISYADNAAFPNGCAFACVRSNAGVWSIQQQLIPGDGAPQQNFGAACGVFGNLAVVVSSIGHGPALYAYARTGNVWAQIQQFQPTVGPNVVLGMGAMTGNQLFITATDQVALTSAVYVYTFIGGVYVLTQTLTQGGASDFFGMSVSCDGNTLVIGGSLTTTGKAFVYTQSGGLWTLQQTLVGSDSAASDQFGAGVAVNGTLMIVGAYHATVGIVAAAGAAYVFQFANGTWTQTQKITAQVPTTATYFGWAVAAFAGSPSWVAIAAPAIGSATIEGSVSFYVGPAIAPLSDPFVTLTFKGEKVYT